MIRKGQAWGADASGPPDLEVEGDDAALARSVTLGVPARLVGYRPSDRSDLARAVGLTRESGRATELTIDAFRVERGADGARVGVNAVVFGVAPDRLTRWTRSRSVEVAIDDRPAWAGPAGGVVVANGQFLRGADVVPRGHPGDGRMETQVYALRAGERGAMRRRLATGTHVPHPRILERAGRVVDIQSRAPLPLEVDGVAWEPTRHVRIAVLPGALRVLV